VDSHGITLQDLAELEHYRNLKEAHLRRLHVQSETEALKVLKKCANLRRITLADWKNPIFPPLKELCDFIMELKHLTFLHIIYHIHNCDHFESHVDQVKAFVLPLRPNFKFYVSCCLEYSEFRVPTEFFYH
jgi:hypothetical protein